MIGGRPGVPIRLRMSHNQQAFHGKHNTALDRADGGHNAAMTPVPVHSLDLADPTVADQVWQLQRAAYRVEAELVGFDGIPPLHESLEDLVAAPLKWIGVEESDGQIAAALAYTETDDRIDIDRLVVMPDRFRLGFGTALLSALGRSAMITVSTGAVNGPAHRLYESQGFTRTRDEEVVPGMWIAHFTKEGGQ